MNRKSLFQIRISHLLWGTLVVAAFFFGRQFGDSGSTQPAAKAVIAIPALGPAPTTFDFADPKATQQAGNGVFSFYIGIQR